MTQAMCAWCNIIRDTSEMYTEIDNEGRYYLCTFCRAKQLSPEGHTNTR